MDNLIDYQKVDTLDQNIINLLKKLESRKPLEVLIRDIEEKFCTVLQVFYNSQSCGILIVRGEVDVFGKMHLVICHAIANEFLVKTFSEVLGYSLFEFARAKGFHFVRQHADRKGLCRMLEKHYGQPTEYIYTKDLISWAAEIANHHKQASSQRPVTTKE